VSRGLDLAAAWHWPQCAMMIKSQ